LTAEAATVCVEKEVALVGIDYITIEKFGKESFDAHRILMKAGILVLESINLVDVPFGTYKLLCFPLKLKGAEASPVRAVLM
jgi:arylformamidase